MRVLVTGGTGSFGRAFVDVCLADPNVERVVVFSRDEVKQGAMHAALGEHKGLRFFLGDIRDLPRLEEAMHSCDTVVHAAALKRVDTIHYNPSEVRKTNILGSANVVAAAVAAGVRRVLMLSSDKAVMPTNAYGISKAQMEAEAVAANAISRPRGTSVACTRWGNVLASRGSVVEIFRAAALAGRPLPITDPTCTRFWLTLPEAVAFARKALALMEGGEIFVPVLPAMQLGDLARAIAPDAKWQIIGLRDGGEKIHETLINPIESSRTVLIDPRTAMIPPSPHSWRLAPWWEGEPLPPGFDYSSDKLGWRLSVDEMRALLKDIS